MATGADTKGRFFVGALAAGMIYLSLRPKGGLFGGVRIHHSPRKRAWKRCLRAAVARGSARGHSAFDHTLHACLAKAQRGALGALTTTDAQRKILRVLTEPGAWSFQGRRGYYTFGSDRTREFVVRAKTVESLAARGRVTWTGAEWLIRKK